MRKSTLVLKVSSVKKRMESSNFVSIFVPENKIGVRVRKCGTLISAGVFAFFLESTVGKFIAIVLQRIAQQVIAIWNHVRVCSYKEMRRWRRCHGD